MIANILAVAVCLAVILLSCALFTNGIEWFGKKLNLGHGAVGSVLAAVGTALPETIIPILAILVYGDEKSIEIGVGAIAGAPFMLATLTFFMTGLAVILYAAAGKRSLKMDADIKIFSRDLSFFLVIYAAAVLTTFIRREILIKDIIALSLFALYIIYIRHTFKHDSGHESGELERLMFSRVFRVRENMLVIVVQVLIALAGIIIGSHLFISNVEHLAALLGVAPLILSIIITPIATELPEKFNSIIWVGAKKDTLALGNVTGAMVFQSCVPVVFGMIFTEWHLTGPTMASAVLAITSSALILAWVRIRKTVNPIALLFGGVLYTAFLVYIFGGAGGVA